MIHEGRDQAAAGHPAAIDLDPVVTAAAGHAVGFEAADDRGKTIALLHAELVEAFHAGGAGGEARGHGKDRELVDHRGGAGGRNPDAAEPGAADPDVAEKLAARLASVVN